MVNQLSEAQLSQVNAVETIVRQLSLLDTGVRDQQTQLKRLRA